MLGDQVLAEALGDEMFGELVYRERPLFMHNDECADALAEDVVGDRYGGYERDGWMRAHRVFDRGGRDVLATPDDEVALASGQCDKATVIDDGDVLHQHPSVPGEQLRVALRIVVVAGACRRATTCRLARSSRSGHVDISFVQAGLHLGYQPAACCQPVLARVGDRRVRVRPRFIRSVELQNLRTGAGLELRGPMVGHRFPPR